MTVPANTARATKRWKALIGTDEYQGHTSAIEYNGNTGSSVWKGGDGNTLADVTPGDPSISLTIAQNTENPQSLWRLLMDSPEGTQLTLIWYPHYDGTYALQTTLATKKPPMKTDRAGGVPEVTVQLSCTEAIPYYATWAASTDYVLGQRVKLTGGQILEATVAGKSGATSPAAPAVGATVVDGGVTWKRIS
jgi:hypothetical protein